MKTIGLIGGTSWVSTLDYYRVINQEVNDRLGGNESARIILHSVNYGEIVKLTHADDWEGIYTILQDAARKLEAAGASCVLLCANTMHRLAGRLQADISIPILHIAEITASKIRQQQLSSVLLLGTRYTMLGDFYPEKLGKQNITMVIPPAEDIDTVNNSIYQEMGKGLFLPETKIYYQELIQRYAKAGIEGVIFGCTEIPLLLKQADSSLPVFDTLSLHALAAVDFALQT